MRTEMQIQADIDAIDARIKQARRYDAVQNENGEGYSTADDLYPAWIALTEELFATEWTPAVTVARRDAWNAVVKNCIDQKLSTRDTDAMLKKYFPFSHAALGRAIGMQS